MPWFAIRVKSNFERRTAISLKSRGYETLVPEYSNKRYGRTVTTKPLLPGYVLCRLDINNRLPILSAPGVVALLGLGRVPESIPECEVERIRLIARSGVSSSPHPYLASGDAVVVQRGPVAGVKGILLDAKNRFRLVVSVRLLQRSIVVELDRDWVRPGVQPMSEREMDLQVS